MTSAIPAYILAGGNSARFGADKARHPVQGQPLVSRIAQIISSRTASQTIVARQGGAYDDLGLRTIADLQPGLGPLAGLHAALSDRAEGWLLLLSCDFVNLNPEWIDTLSRARTEDASIVAFRRRHWEPLFALYHTRLKEPIERQIATPERALWRLIESAPHLACPLPQDWPALAHVNTPGELARAMEEYPRPKD